MSNLGNLQVRQIGYLSHWDAYPVISLEAVVYSSRWSGSGGIDAYSVANWLLSVLLHCWMDHLTCKNRP